jgi:hypothetical protein
MAYKQTSMGHKTLVYSGVGFPLQGLLAKLLNAVKISIPVGYQDENGFHYGVKQVGKQTEWPSNW